MPISLIIVSVFAVAALLYAAFAWGPFGLRARYQRLVAQAESTVTSLPAATVNASDLVPLPEPVQRYLRFAGVLGQPRVQHFQVRMTGRIRSAADAPWMPFTAEQHSFFNPPRRYFFMRATRAGLPLDGLHAYTEEGASMQIRLLSMATVVKLSGPLLTRTETVTLLNDMAIMAPGALLDPAIRWRLIDEHQVEATYRLGPNEVRAVLVFGADGALVNFWSDDRPALAPDGITLQAQRWSTPVGDYHLQGSYRLATRGEARYAAPAGEYAYAEFSDIEITVPDTKSTKSI